MNDEAEELRDRNRLLMSEIESLWTEIARDWHGTATTKVAELKTYNANIKRAITGMNDKVKRAQNAAKILSLLDDVIGLATGL